MRRYANRKPQSLLQMNRATVVTSSDTHSHLLQAMNAGKGCILDSGTTDTYLPVGLAKKFGKAAMLWTDGLTDFSVQTPKPMRNDAATDDHDVCGWTLLAAFQPLPPLLYVIPAIFNRSVW